MSTNDYQVGGSHYNTTFQHWDFVTECLGGLYLEGCATKYVTRWRKKNGIQDLQKSLHYIGKLKEISDTGDSGPAGDVRRVQEFCRANDLQPLEIEVITKIATWRDRADLEEIDVLINCIIDDWHRGFGVPFS